MAVAAFEKEKPTGLLSASTYGCLREPPTGLVSVAWHALVQCFGCLREAGLTSYSVN